MVDNNPDDLLRKLKTLSKREAQVLVLRCGGMTYPAIGKALSIAVPTVKTDIGRVYMKLGLDVLEPSVRLKVLYDTICPLLKARKPAAEKEETKPEDVIDGVEVEGGEEQTVPEKIMHMVENDGKEIVPWQPAPLVAPLPRRPRRPIWPVVLVLGVVLGICVGAGAIYLILGGLKSPLPFVPPPTATILPPTPLPSVTALPSPTVAVAPTQAPAPVPPTEIPMPTATIPSPTAVFVPPADGILFQDNFDNGLKPEWTQYSGQWIVSDGKLTEVYQQTSTDAYSWIGVENPSWKNYIVDVTIQIYQPLTESDEIALAVRDNTVGSKYIGFEIDFWPHIYLSLISQGYSSSDPIAGNNKDFTFPLKADGQTEIKVENNNYTLSVNGSTLQTVNISGYDSGGFRLGLYCRGYPRCPTFDNVKVTYLP